MKRLAQPLVVLSILTLAMTGCSAAHDAPFDLGADQTGCQISIGNTQATATAPTSMNDYGPLIDGQSETRTGAPNAGESWWQAEASLTEGVLTVRVSQPSIGEQAATWVVSELPFEGATMTGPWGGPYEASGAEGDNYYFTCWTNPST